ncbi:hypothetical protein E2C04_16290 [Nocardioides daphniae]|uniref:NAD-dependent epimerase/dehydratase family protein n=1 Tax=Nocardioides daphniae TaxID=402297 RepID=A0A4P7UE26_9ACTN|nr:hypothetical protein E2C04_16290 [Nocardioides daphniae]
MPTSVTWQAVDISSDDLRPLLRGADVVVHLAWKMQPNATATRARPRRPAAPHRPASAAWEAVKQRRDGEATGPDRRPGGVARTRGSTGRAPGVTDPHEAGIHVDDRAVRTARAGAVRPGRGGGRVRLRGEQ